jgi:hypothetical protein
LKQINFLANKKRGFKKFAHSLKLGPNRDQWFDFFCKKVGLLRQTTDTAICSKK